MTEKQAKKKIVSHVERLLNAGWDGRKPTGDMPPALPFVADAGGGQKPAKFRIVLGRDQAKGWQGNLFIP